ncbi:MAG TPA: GntR family transcriptional regulator [Anaerolineales bacterium]
MTSLDRNSPVPLYYQVKQILLEKLDKGTWKPGDLVPSEQELQELYGVSRITVRQALTELTHEGRFERHRGQGTFVANKPLVHNPMKRISITELMRQQDIEPEWQIRQRDFVTPLPNVSDTLGIRSNSKVYFVDFLLSADEEPIGRHITYLTKPVAESTNVASLSDLELGEFFRALPNDDGIQVRRTVQALPASSEEAKLLKVRTGFPILSIEVTYSDANGKPIEHLRANYRGDRFQFQLDI